MRQNGLEAAVKKYAAAGRPVFGICGGYQMLGKTIRDPEGVEHGGEITGMGLLPVETVFAGDKTTRQVSGSLGKLTGELACLSDLSFSGYEIHMGRSTVLAEKACETGYIVNSQNVYGSYVHGIFDAPQIAERLVQLFCKKKNISCRTGTVDRHTYKEQQYEKLAQTLRQSLDMEALYRILQLKKM